MSVQHVCLCFIGMGGMNGGLGASMANGSAASSMDALTQAYSGMQQYTASALPSLYGQSLLQQSMAGSQKEGERDQFWFCFLNKINSLIL